MSYLARFAFPEYLLLLAIVPLAIYLGVRLRSLHPWRKRAAIGIRCLLLIALIFALAGMEVVKTSDKLAVFFLLDHSNSVGESLRLAAAQSVRNTADAHMGPRDEAGVIVFGENASIELSAAPKLGMRDIKSFVGGEATDLAAAIRLATAAFPQGYMRRILVYSDGNETRGSALEEVKAARAAGIEVSVVPLRLDGGADARVREVRTPGRVDANEPFSIQVVVHSSAEGDAELTLYQRAGSQRQQMPPQRVRLRKGENVFQVAQELSAPGVYEYEVRLEAQGDAVLQNNVGRGYSIVQGPSKVLYVESQTDASTYLAPALRKEGLEVEQITPGALPADLAFYQAYGAVVLSDVSAVQLGAESMKVIEAAVRDLGIGLVMIGGPDTFGAGGFLDSPVERALPVSMDIKQRKILPRGALGLVMHTCEIPDGNVWAREIGLAALNVLASQDLMGGWGYTYNGGDSELFPLQAVGDKSAVRSAILSSAEIIGDMPDVTATLRMAFAAVAGADAAVKRIIMISDGDPAAPPQSLLTEIAAAKVSVSTVCIAPHSGSDQGMLQGVADATGGQYYFVNSAYNLPQIFAKEAAVVRRGILNEEEFVPVVQAPSEILQGLLDAPLPSLRGYVITTAKDTAAVPIVSHEGDPVLAHWRFGLGKAAAFTSDVTPRWAANWLGWDRFSRYWVQAVRWAMREAPQSPFQVDTRVAEGKGHVRIDAVDPAGNFVNFLAPAGVATGPDLAPLQLDFKQTGPGIYEAEFSAEAPGSYFTNVAYTTPDGGSGALSSGLSVNYAREYEYNQTNLPFLEALASAGGGQVYGGEGNPFEHSLVASATATPLWPYLLALAAGLLTVEIFVRRVMLPWLPVYRVIHAVLRHVPGLGPRLTPPERFQRTATGAYLSGGAPVVGPGPAPTASFGAVKEPAQTAAPPVAKQRPKAPPPQTHTSELLAAKERARAREKRRTSSGEDEKEKP
jgi:uncharacterized membrane protein